MLVRVTFAAERFIAG